MKKLLFLSIICLLGIQGAFAQTQEMPYINGEYDTLRIETDPLEAQFIWNLLVYKNVPLKDSLLVILYFKSTDKISKNYRNYTFRIESYLQQNDTGYYTGVIKLYAYSVYGNYYKFNEKEIGGLLISAEFSTRIEGILVLGRPFDTYQNEKRLYLGEASRKYKEILGEFNKYFASQKSIQKKKKKIQKIEKKIAKKLAKEK